MSSQSRIPDDRLVGGPVLRALVADDDPASCRFLGDGLQTMGTDVAACNDGLHALGRARLETFDLLLLDCHMPGAGALAIVHALRTDRRAASHAAVMVATSAELSSAERQALLTAGCNGILDKPCTLAALRNTIGSIATLGDALLVLDDDAGLRTSGDYATLGALRQLLHDELSVLDRELEILGRDPVGLGNRLHRLQAACGFCGTVRLAQAARKLKLKLNLDQDQDQDQDDSRVAAISAFRVVLTEALRALRLHLQGSAAGAGHGQHVP